jgi:2-methylcitrate dehydratase PrpD
MTAAEWALRVRIEDIPQDARHQLRRCLLDGIGAAIAGAQTRSGRIAAEFADAIGREGNATVLASGRRLAVAPAAFANAVAANAWDCDDGYRLAKGHPGAFIIMPAINASEENGGQDLLCAIAAGYEIALRAAIATHRHYHHYHASGSWGALGTAACVGRIIGLDEQRMRWALGLAEYHAALAPIERCLGTPGMTKDAIGWGAFAGACAAYLAQKGFTANPGLLDDVANEDLVQDLGCSWRLLELYFKPHACCRWAQPAVDAILRLRNEHRLQAEQVESILVHTVEAATHLFAGAPTTEEEAQYSLGWPIAAALVHGEVGPEQMGERALQDPRCQRLASRVGVAVDPELDARFPLECLAWIEVQTLDSRRLHSEVTGARGDPHVPLSDAALERKFRRLCDPIIGGATDDLLDAVSHVAEPGGPERLVQAVRAAAEAFSSRPPAALGGAVRK